MEPKIQAPVVATEEGQGKRLLKPGTGKVSLFRNCRFLRWESRIEPYIKAFDKGFTGDNMERFQLSLPFQG